MADTAVVELLPVILTWLVPPAIGLTKIVDEILILTDFVPVDPLCFTVTEFGSGLPVKVFTPPFVEPEADADVLPEEEVLSAAVTVIVLEAPVPQPDAPKYAQLTSPNVIVVSSVELLYEVV